MDGFGMTFGPESPGGYRASRSGDLVVEGPAGRTERRRAGVEDLESLGELAQGLGQLLFWRALRRLAST